ncbi:MAG: methyltransferase family protein [Candidatus Binatia bacterium]
MRVDRHVSSRRQVLRESWARFADVVPDMRRPWCAALLWGGITVGTALCILLGSRAASTVSCGAVMVQAVLLSWAGGWMFLGFWRHRAAYRQRYASVAYRHLFFRFLIPFFVGGGAAVYFPLFIGGPQLLRPAIAYSLAAYCFVTVQLMERRGVEIFWDIEWRAFVYNVFPERGHVATSGIFAWLRHPVYSGAIRFAFGLALVRNNLSALLCAALVGVGVWFLGTMEEREFTQTDAQYANYRTQVPAFFARHPVRFWRYLVTWQREGN